MLMARGSLSGKTRSTASQSSGKRPGKKKSVQELTVDSDYADEHQWEDEESPGWCERFDVVLAVEPDHEHGDADEESKANIDKKEADQ